MTPQPFRFEIGDQVKDRVTHFVGVVTNRRERDDAVNQYEVTSQIGAQPQVQWFSEHRLEPKA